MKNSDAYLIAEVLAGSRPVFLRTRTKRPAPAGRPRVKPVPMSPVALKEGGSMSRNTARTPHSVKPRTRVPRHARIVRNRDGEIVKYVGPTHSRVSDWQFIR